MELKKPLFYLQLIIIIISCKQQPTDLEKHFDELRQMSPPMMIQEFKQMPLDSAVINNERFNEIFVATANLILMDSLKKDALEIYFKSNNIDLLGRQDKWTIVAAFHKFLNNEKYEIYELWEEMVKLSNSEYEKQFPNPEH